MKKLYYNLNKVNLMDKIKVKIDEMLNHFGNNNSISFSQDTTDEMFKARDKLRAFGLIEEHKKYSIIFCYFT